MVCWQVRQERNALRLPHRNNKNKKLDNKVSIANLCIICFCCCERQGNSFSFELVDIVRYIMTMIHQ